MTADVPRQQRSSAPFQCVASLDIEGRDAMAQGQFSGGVKPPVP